ncbi:hypothetical protein [Stenotrophomonas sp. SAU14A_NAIMI4_8]|uniref:hypothetical protein n=1 Tax=Stenotrophomonas sp. SAU14A_NAIMI4_8 TaxID=2072409 RepID=UPI000D53E39F|nr:hypothetical protein [Stenotrophomonas sp. SAU14A_NAIMI4_8]AWH34427.1 hypothetical protein C1930_16905 [Stenotrophomonas sp. SAU14A_NAIMI4_8]
MTTLYPTYPRLQALLGNALPGLALPSAVAEALEDALMEAAETTPPSAFFTRLRGVAHEADDARGRGLADAARCLAALSACGSVLLAAQSARELDDVAAQCPAQVEEGLLQAVVVLAGHAGALVHDVVGSRR